MPCLPTFDCHSIARTTTTRMTKSVVYRLLPRPIPHLPTLRLTLTQHLPGSHSLLCYFFSLLFFIVFFILPNVNSVCVRVCIDLMKLYTFFLIRKLQKLGMALSNLTFPRCCCPSFDLAVAATWRVKFIVSQ